MKSTIIQFFKDSYLKDKPAFYAEIVEAAVLICASAFLSFTIIATAESNPYARVFIPLYLVGSLLAVFSTYRRRSSAVVLCVWFTFMNGWAFTQLFIL
jgi:hypothetical protein